MLPTSCRMRIIQVLQPSRNKDIMIRGRRRKEICTYREREREEERELRRNKEKRELV